jgi:hypothetical protein
VQGLRAATTVYWVLGGTRQALLCLFIGGSQSQLHDVGLFGGGGVHVYMFAHDKSGIAYQDRNRRPETVVAHKREHHQQPRLLPSCTNSAPDAGEG